MHSLPRECIWLSFLVDEFASDRCSVIVQSVEILGNDFVVESVFEDILVAGLEDFIGTVVEFEEGFVVFCAGYGIEPDFLLFVQTVFPFEMLRACRYR